MLFLAIDLDQAVLNFSQDNILILKFCLGFIMYGVALNLQIKDFREILVNPRSVAVGLLSQVILLPATTVGLILLVNPHPSLALGMILVAACPGGPLSNFISHYSGGNAELSVSLTTATTLLSTLTTPFNFAFWSQMIEVPGKTVTLDFLEMAIIILELTIIPTFLGMLTRYRFPKFAERISKIFRIGSLIIFGIFIVGAFADNVNTFVKYLYYFLLLVLGHNLVALATGAFTARIFKVPGRDLRTITIETGIQNGSTSVLLTLTFFGGVGGMALIVGWWAIWDMCSSLLLAFYWSKRPVKETPKTQKA
ncbi:hypothetical protein BKI52_04180 [marine bacterium AO1-C]|nr:hypothetical protein BKI52_04180 [marine bacterium AO1-C]